LTDLPFSDHVCILNHFLIRLLFLVSELLIEESKVFFILLPLDGLKDDRFQHGKVKLINLWVKLGLPQHPQNTSEYIWIGLVISKGQMGRGPAKSDDLQELRTVWDELKD
jgi:hypothetical protein